MTKLNVSIAAAVMMLTSATLSADRLRLRSGKVVDGTFVAADSKTVRMLLANGELAQVPVGDIAGVDFSPRVAAPKAAVPSSPPQAAPRPATLTVPAGTLLNVRLSSAIDVDASKAGQTFPSLLDDAVMLNGHTAIPRGASVLLKAAAVKQSGAFKGSDKITLQASAVSFGGSSYAIVTSFVSKEGSGEGKKTARKIGGGAGLGAIVGGIAGGGSGAAVGAAVGAFAGTAVAASGEEHLKVPVETRLQFQLQAAIDVRR